MPDRESLGGPAACEPPFVAALRRRGVEVAEETYVFGDKLGPTAAGRRVARVLATAGRLRRRLAGESFDLVHLNTSFDTKALLRDAATVALLGGTRAKIFFKFHGSDAALLRTANPLLRALGRMLLRRADGIGVLSTEEKRNFLAGGVPAGKIFVVKNVVERDDLIRGGTGRGDLPQGGAGGGDALAARLGLNPRVPRLLFVARFIPAKGLLDVVRACGLLRERGREFALLCVGDGPARAEAEGEAARRGLSDAVRFCGFVPESETAQFYRGSTMLVFPTCHYEGFPMVVFYSLAAGLPVVTTRIRAAADYLREPDNCLWVEPRNPEMLAEKIVRLLEDTGLRAAMSENNRRLAGSFGAEAVAGEYLEAYRRVTEGAAPRA